MAMLLALGLASSVNAQRGGGWEELGKKEIEGRVDHDKINCHGNQTYRAYPFRMLVRANGSSPVLDPVGGDRDITNVEFWYEKASWGKKPEVRLFGRR